MKKFRFPLMLMAMAACLITIGAARSGPDVDPINPGDFSPVEEMLPADDGACITVADLTTHALACDCALCNCTLAAVDLPVLDETEEVIQPFIEFRAVPLTAEHPRFGLRSYSSIDVSRTDTFGRSKQPGTTNHNSADVGTQLKFS